MASNIVQNYELTGFITRLSFSEINIGVHFVDEVWRMDGAYLHLYR